MGSVLDLFSALTYCFGDFLKSREFKYFVYILPVYINASEVSLHSDSYVYLVLTISMSIDKLIRPNLDLI